MKYTLVALETGNLVGFYDSREEALKVIQGAISEFGPEWADDYSLDAADEEGLPEPVAEGPDLVALALAHEAQRVG